MLQLCEKQIARFDLKENRKIEQFLKVDCATEANQIYFKYIWQ